MDASKESLEKGKAMTYSYRKATAHDLERIWEKNISNHEGDHRWIEWKKEAIENNKAKKSATFVILNDDELIGEGTILFSPDCKAIAGRNELSNNVSVANINGLRIQKDYEGQGHISKLMQVIKNYATKCGYSYLTIGVEARETRNLVIYLHWGYDEFIMYAMEDNSLVLYYQKLL